MAKKYTLADGAILNTQEGSTEFKIAGSSGLLYSEEKPIFMADSTVYDPYYVETITLTSAGLSVSTAPAYGVTYIQTNTTGGDFSTSPHSLTLAAPIPGVKKTLILGTTAAAVNTLDVTLDGATVITSSGVTAAYIAFSSLATDTQVVEMIGVSSALWGVLGVESTYYTFGVAAGIRGTTIARTS